jgi:lipoprotein signal peptidase
VLCAGLDLGHKALALAGTETVFVHERSWLWVASLAALPVLEGAAIAATGSVAIALAGGVLVGGSAGNLVSAAVWGGVPDPLGAGNVVFSLADVFIVAGAAAVLPCALAFARRNRGRLYAPARSSLIR